MHCNNTLILYRICTTLCHNIWIYTLCADYLSICLILSYLILSYPIISYLIYLWTMDISFPMKMPIFHIFSISIYLTMPIFPWRFGKSSGRTLPLPSSSAAISSIEALGTYDWQRSWFSSRGRTETPGGVRGFSVANGWSTGWYCCITYIHNYGKIHHAFFMGKSTISTGPFEA